MQTDWSLEILQVWHYEISDTGDSQRVTGGWQEAAGWWELTCPQWILQKFIFSHIHVQNIMYLQPMESIEHVSVNISHLQYGMNDWTNDNILHSDMPQSKRFFFFFFFYQSRFSITLSCTSRALHQICKSRSGHQSHLIHWCWGTKCPLKPFFNPAYRTSGLTNYSMHTHGVTNPYLANTSAGRSPESIILIDHSPTCTQSAFTLKEWPTSNLK